MSQANVDVLRRAYAAFQRGEFTEALADIDENQVARRVAPMPDPITYHGPEGYMQMLLDWVEDFDEFKMTAEEFIDANDDQVVIRIHQHALGTQSGVPIEADFWFVHTLRGGKGQRVEIYASKAQAFEAAGLQV